jgi:hypothetical protein
MALYNMIVQDNYSLVIEMTGMSDGLLDRARIPRHPSFDGW